MKPEVLILEDESFYQELIQKSVPENMPSIIAGTSEELRAALEANPDIKMFILDDKVPSTAGDKPKFHFLENAQAVIEKNPNASIVYIGSAPGPDQKNFCKERGIIMIERYEIRDLFKGKDAQPGEDIAD